MLCIYCYQTVPVIFKTPGNTHIFNENGEFTFEYVDEAGNNGMATAIVNWINKDLEKKK